MADMTNEQAALQIEKLRNSMTYKSDSPAVDTHTKRLVAEYVEALRMGAAALRGWVKTADRLPTREDANKDMRVLAKVAKDGTVKEVRFEELSWIEWGGAYYFSHWMKLPEVEG